MFLTTVELKGTWEAYFSARPPAALGEKLRAVAGRQDKPQRGPDGRPRRKWVDICFQWNRGLCLRVPGECKSPKGQVLRHVCNFVANPRKPDEYCGKEHACKDFHKEG